MPRTACPGPRGRTPGPRALARTPATRTESALVARRRNPSKGDSYTVYSMEFRASTTHPGPDPASDLGPRRPFSRRENLAHEVAAELRDRIIDGRFDPGQRLNEVHLAAELGVSRTPLREALTRLEGEGFVEQAPRRGYFVKPLELDEIESLYAIRAILDPEALRAAGVPTKEQIERLERLNVEIEAADDPAEIIALDDRWHLELLLHGGNAILLDLIRNFMHRTRRYEHAYMRQRGNVAVAVDQHRRILDALRRADLDSAVDILRQNMQTAPGPIRSSVGDSIAPADPA